MEGVHHGMHFTCPVYISNPSHYQGWHCGDVLLKSLGELYTHMLTAHLGATPWDMVSLEKRRSQRDSERERLTSGSDHPARAWKVGIIQKARERFLKAHEVAPPVGGRRYATDVVAWLRLAKTIFPTLLGLRLAAVEGADGSFIFREEVPPGTLQCNLLRENAVRDEPLASERNAVSGQQPLVPDADEAESVGYTETRRVKRTADDDGASLSDGEDSDDDDDSGMDISEEDFLQQTRIPSVARALKRRRLNPAKPADFRKYGRITIPDLLNPHRQSSPTGPPPSADPEGSGSVPGTNNARQTSAPSTAASSPFISSPASNRSFPPSPAHPFAPDSPYGPITPTTPTLSRTDVPAALVLYPARRPRRPSAEEYSAMMRELSNDSAYSYTPSPPAAEGSQQEQEQEQEQQEKEQARHRQYGGHVMTPSPSPSSPPRNQRCRWPPPLSAYGDLTLPHLPRTPPGPPPGPLPKGGGFRIIIPPFRILPQTPPQPRQACVDFTTTTIISPPPPPPSADNEEEEASDPARPWSPGALGTVQGFLFGTDPGLTAFPGSHIQARGLRRGFWLLAPAGALEFDETSGTPWAYTLPRMRKARRGQVRLPNFRERDAAGWESEDDEGWLDA